MLLSDPITCHTGPLQEVAKLLLAGGKGGDQVLSAVSRHGRAHLTTSSDPVEEFPSTSCE